MRVSDHDAFVGIASACVILFVLLRRADHAQSLFLPAFLPKGACRSRPLASASRMASESCAVPRLTVAGGQPMIVPLQPFGLPAGIETAISADSVPKGRTMTAFSRSERIRQLNDEFRTTLDGEKCLFTPYVADMGVPFEVAALEAVKIYKAFTSENDPYGEHDFGIFEIDEEQLVWKIDYYDLSLRFGSQDPADPSRTKRVLTIMLEEEA